MALRAPSRQQGSVTVLVAGMLVVTLLLCMFILILADGLTQHDLVQDAAEALARPALINQLTYRNLGNTDTKTLVKKLAGDAALDTQLRNGAIQYVFGNYDATSKRFTPIDDPDPDPAMTAFNAIALEVSSPLADFGVGIELGQINGRAIYYLPLGNDEPILGECLCDEQCGRGGNLGNILNASLCHLSCAVTGLVTNLLSLDIDGLLYTLSCIGKAGQYVAEDAWDWLWGDTSVTIEISVSA